MRVASVCAGWTSQRSRRPQALGRCRLPAIRASAPRAGQCGVPRPGCWQPRLALVFRGGGGLPSCPPSAHGEPGGATCPWADCRRRQGWEPRVLGPPGRCPLGAVSLGPSASGRSETGVLVCGPTPLASARADTQTVLSLASQPKPSVGLPHAARHFCRDCHRPQAVRRVRRSAPRDTVSGRGRGRSCRLFTGAARGLDENLAKHVRTFH